MIGDEGNGDIFGPIDGADEAWGKFEGLECGVWGEVDFGEVEYLEQFGFIEGDISLDED